jgi:glycine oxidase
MTRTVLIVGAGVAGLGIGWRLAQSGLAVTIIERDSPASGATFAAAGMIAVTAEMAHAPPAEIAFATHARALWPGFAAALEAASGVALDYRQNGALLVADGPPDTLPPGTVWLDGATARLRAPLLGDVAGAVWAQGEAQVDSRALGRALVAAFTAAGGVLVSGVEVMDITPRGVTTAAGLHAADVVILAAGAWSGRLLEQVKVSPVKGQMIALTPSMGTALPDPVIWGNGVYLVPRNLPDGTGHLIVGATVEQAGFDLRLTTTARDDLHSRAMALAPALKAWTLTDQWAGLRPGSPDGLPLLGSLADGLFVAGGQYRNGILFAPAIADHMRDLVLGRAEPIAAFDPKRFA